MNKQQLKNQRYIAARKKLQNLKVFYIHLAGYIVLVALLVYNLIIIEENQYKESIIWLNCTTIIVWGIFLSTHAWRTFKGRIWFKKDWENKKMNEYMDKQNQYWE